MLMKFKYYIFIVLFLANINYSQDLLILNGQTGYFINHNKNEKLTTDDEKLIWNFGLSVSYEHAISKNLNLGLGINYLQTSAKINKSDIVNIDGEKTGDLYTQLTHISTPLDIYCVYSLKSILTYGFGISYVTEKIKYSHNSSFVLIRPYMQNTTSSGLGYNFLLRMTYPLYKKNIIFSPMFKIQYFESYWYNKEFKYSSDYSYFQIYFSLGIGLGLNVY